MNRAVRLVDGRVSVVRVPLDGNRPFGHLLSSEEHRRAAGFRRAVDRDRYVAGRGVLRTLLAERLDRDPAGLRIVPGPHGKPRLADEDGFDGDFNVSHSGGELLFAFAEAGDVGVDLEAVRPLDPIALADTCFSPAERAELRDVGHPGGDEQLLAFFDGWVRKEAVIKADGRGVSVGLERFTVTLRGPARLVQWVPDEGAARWTLTSLDAGRRFRAAFAHRVPSSCTAP